MVFPSGMGATLADDEVLAHGAAARAKRSRVKRSKISSFSRPVIQSAMSSATAGAIMKPWPTKPLSWRKLAGPAAPRMGLLSGVTS